MSTEVSIIINIGNKTYKREGFIPVTKKGAPLRVVSYRLDQLLAEISKDIKKDFPA